MKDKRRSEFSQYLSEDGLKKFAAKSVRARQGIINRLFFQLRKELGWECIDKVKWQGVDPEVIWVMIRSSKKDTVAMRAFKGLFGNHLGMNGITLRGHYKSFKAYDGHKTQGVEVPFEAHKPKTLSIEVTALGRGSNILSSDSIYAAQCLAFALRSNGFHTLNKPGRKFKVRKRPSTKG
jgi:hypothetical protein